MDDDDEQNDVFEDYNHEYETESFTVRNPNNCGCHDDTLTFEVLTVVPPPIEYMSTLHRNNQEISGRQIWAGSAILANFIAHHPYYVKGKRVLELGSGTGVVGMLAARLGARCVALTDGDAVAVSLLQQNLINERNRVNTNEIAAATTLRWGEREEKDMAKGSGSDFDGWCRSKWPAIFDHHQHEIKFDVILAGDVMYKAGLPELFFMSVQRYLEIISGEGELLLCHLPRASVTQQVVIAAAMEAGLFVETLPFDVDSWTGGTLCLKEDVDHARLYRIRAILR